MTTPALMNALRIFVEDRDWNQFHTAENLAKSISIEAGELLECFQWGEPRETPEPIDELADVLTYCFLLANKFGVDPDEVVLSKLQKTAAKYPLDKAKGTSTKYDKL
jgi:dCTP diphosphatase